MLKKAPFELKNLDLNDVARETAEFLSSLAIGRKVELLSVITPDALPILGDRIQLQQVILNLVVNGIDAMRDTPSETRVISIRTSRVEELAELSVSDRGPGISEDKLKEVFEPFYTGKAEGMGMGLSIARTILEAHHGLISAKNRDHGGATFKIRLPLRHSETGRAGPIVGRSPCHFQALAGAQHFRSPKLSRSALRWGELAFNVRYPISYLRSHRSLPDGRPPTALSSLSALRLLQLSGASRDSGHSVRRCASPSSRLIPRAWSRGCAPHIPGHQPVRHAAGPCRDMGARFRTPFHAHQPTSRAFRRKPIAGREFRPRHSQYRPQARAHSHRASSRHDTTCCSPP